MKKKGEQFLANPADVPPEFGTTPIPEGMVRFHHFTRAEENLPKIMSEGLLERHAQESYARGGSEAPVTFATAGAPNEDYKRSKYFVEGWANPAGWREGGQLDVGENYGGWDPAEHVKSLEGRQSTITFRGDVPASQMVAAHKPWHEIYRYLMNDPGMHDELMAGVHDNLIKEYPQDYGPAIQAAKIAIRARRGGGM